MLVEGPGTLHLSRNNFTNATAGRRVQYFESVAVAFSARPGIDAPDCHFRNKSSD